MSFQAGEQVGDYQVLQVLGAGGMGQVYKVRNTISDRVEAMKVLLPNLSSDPDLANRFLREIKTQASLVHPHIASLHTAQRVGNQLIMLMEYVEGRTVEQMLGQGPLAPTAVLPIMDHVLQALAYAHARGVVHRDIKPANIMVNAAGDVKLMDFGIARMAADRGLTQTGRTVGSLYYMSPEQINGAQLDGRADLYSLGITLYEMVTGMRPFRGDSDFSIMAAHLQSAPVPPIQIDPAVPPLLNDVILTSIAKDAAQRFQTADAFRAALGNVAKSGFAPPVPGNQTTEPHQMVPGPALPPPPMMPLPAPAPSSFRGAYIAVGALVALTVVGGAAWLAPRYLQTLKAGGTPTAQTDIPKPIPAPVVTPPVKATSPEPGALTPKAANPPTEPATRPQEPSERVKRQEPESTTVPKAQPIPNRPEPAVTSQNRPPLTAPPVSTPVQNPVEPPVTSAPPTNQRELREAQQKLRQLAVRIATVEVGLKSLRRAQEASGYGLRADVVAAHQRLQANMDEAEAALKAGDLAEALEKLGYVQNDLNTIEKVLGH